MNIAIVGPEKYKFQDLVCVELALSLRNSGLSSMVAEPQGGEDTEFTWDDVDGIARLEVQVKGTQNDFTVAALADYLTHYPSHKATGSLLERLVGNPTHGALFVTSGRLTDPLTDFGVARGITAIPTSHSVSRETLRQFVASLTALAGGTPASKLDAKRRLDIDRLAKLPPMKLRYALSRVFVVAEEIDATVETRLHAHLRAMRFATYSLRGAIAELTDELDSAKKSQTDLLPPMLRRLTQIAPASVAPLNYVDLGTEKVLLDKLLSTGVLLLSGPPRAGKSWTQRALGGVLQQAGYEVRRGSSVEEAERFLTDAAGGERLFLLDDPFGSRERTEKASAAFSDLRRLIENLPRNRHLIVAQVDHVLFEVCRKSDLAQCPVGTVGWIPVRPIAVEAAHAIWAQEAKAMHIDADVVTRIDGLIDRDERLRSPGALAYLATAWADLPSNLDDNSIGVFAHGDATDFARILVDKSPDMEPVLVSMAIATGIDQGTFTTELAYVVDGDGSQPGLVPELGVISMTDEVVAPDYSTPPMLTAAQTAIVDQLSRRRVFEERQQRLNFTHPYLRAGAQMLVMPDLPADMAKVRDRLVRGIGSLSPETSLAVARNLRWVRAMMAGSEDPALCFAVAEHGLRSIFPATRDACFAFLLDHVDDLSDEMREEIPQWAERSIVEIDDIFVDRGLAFIFPNSWPFGTLNVSITQVSPYVDAIEKDETLGLDLPLARQILTALADHPERMTVKMINRFLRADEAVVRAEATRIWLRIPRTDDHVVLDRIGLDRAPAVAVAVLKSAVVAWPKIDEKRRARLLGILNDQAETSPTASALLSRLVLFDRVERFGENPPWIIFARLMPTILDRLPTNVALSDGRFNNALEHAIASGLGEELSPIVIAWSRRVVERVREYFVDDYELGMIDPLLRVARPDARAEVFEQLYGLVDTGARVVIAADIADDWNLLTQDERDRFFVWVREPRSDRRWVDATLLTRRDVDPAIIEAVTGLLDLEGHNAAQLEALLGPDRFEACVRMFVGVPQPLWAYGKHHSARKLWIPIIHAIAADPGHRLFEACFEDTLSFADEATIEKIVGRIPSDGLQKAFATMLAAKVCTVGDWHCEAWVSLLERGELAGLLEDWLVRIDENLDGILEDVIDSKRWLASSRFAKRVEEMARADFIALTELYRIVDVAARFDTAPNVEEKNEDNVALALTILFDEVMKRILANPPRLHGTWSRIMEFAKQFGASAETKDRVEDQRLAAIERHHELRRTKMDSSATIQLKGWVDLTRNSHVHSAGGA